MPRRQTAASSSSMFSAMQWARNTGTRTQVAVTRRSGTPKILRVSCITLVSSSLYPVSGSTFVLCENTLNAYGCGSTFGVNGAAFEIRARRFAELFHRGGAGAGSGLVGGHDDALDAALLVYRPQRRGGDDRHAVRIRDDAVVLCERTRR